MSTLAPKPAKIRVLNTKLLPIAAILLVVLGLLFMVTPLLRTTGALPRTGNIVTQGTTGQPGASNGVTTTQGGGRFFTGSTGLNGSGRRVAVGGGAFGIVFFFVALLASLAAALGMLFTKRWGQVLGIVMAALYGLLGLVSFLPLLFIRLIGIRNPISLVLGAVHVLLAAAVIVLASFPPKAAPVPAEAAPAPKNKKKGE